jgi:uncharacterized membrane protein YhaH (DUF805 family)
MRWYDVRWFVKVLRQYADFNGRAQRAEYWMFILISSILSAALGVIDAVVLGFGPNTSIPLIGGWGPLSWLFNLALLLPTLAVTARRLHDRGHSGWWQMLDVPLLVIATFELREPLIVALIGIMVGMVCSLILLIVLVIDGIPEPNRWGVNPKAVAVSPQNSPSDARS